MEDTGTETYISCLWLQGLPSHAWPLKPGAIQNLNAVLSNDKHTTKNIKGAMGMPCFLVVIKAQCLKWPKCTLWFISRASGLRMNVIGMARLQYFQLRSSSTGKLFNFDVCFPFWLFIKDPPQHTQKAVFMKSSGGTNLYLVWLRNWS
jgi:hypothetical protein